MSTVPPPGTPSPDQPGEQLGEPAGGFVAPGSPPPVTPPPASGGWGPAAVPPPSVGPTPAPGFGPSPQAPFPTPPGPGQSPGQVPPAYGAPPPGYGQAPQWAAQRPGIIPLRPLGMGEVFDGAFKAIRFNPKVIFGLSALVLVVSNVVTVLLIMPALSRIPGLMDIFFDPFAAMDATATSFAPTNSQLIALALSGAGASLIQLVATTILQGMLVVAVSDAVIGKKPGPAQVWAIVRPRFFALLGASLLVSLIIMCPVVVWVLLIVLAALTNVVGLVVFVALVGGLATIAAIVLLTIRTLFVTQTLILEKQSVGQALGRSWRITRPVFWRLVGIMILTYIMVGIITSIFSSAIQFIGIFLSISTTSGAGWVAVGSIVVSLIATLITTPFIAAMTSLLYIDSRMRHEGLDIQLARATSA